MNRKRDIRFCLIALISFTVTACGSDEQAGSRAPGSVVHSKPDVEAPKTSPSKLAAPIEIDYEIMGKPVVGIPLSINVKISSGLEQPIRVNYRINDSTSLMFTDAQSETVSLVPLGDSTFSSEQVTVIPQREGRLFLNVSAEVDTDVGMTAKVMAIPIQVGSPRPTPQVTSGQTSGEEEQAPLAMPLAEQ